MTQLNRLVYFSAATQLFTKAELVDLLSQAREKNKGLGISGILLYKDGSFLQLIEGEDASINALYASISKDPRHHDIVVVFDEPISERLFGDWSMGFYDLGDPAVKSLPGYSPFMGRSLTAESYADDSSGCLELLNLFR